MSNLFSDQAKLARKWSTNCKDNLRNILEALQQLITIRIITTNYTRDFCAQEDVKVTLPTKFMKVTIR